MSYSISTKKSTSPPPPHKIVVVDELFKSFEDAKIFLKTKEKEMKTKPRIGKKTSIYEVDGYKFSSRLTPKNTAEVSNRITEEKLASIAPGMCLSAKKGNTYIILPVYETGNTQKMKNIM